MAITRRWQCGMELGDTSEFLGGIGGTGGVTASATTPFTGTYKMILSTTTGFGYGIVPLAATRQIRAGMRWSTNNSTLGSVRNIFFIRDSGGTKLLSVAFSGSGGGSNMSVHDSAGTAQDTAIGVVTGDWMHIGIDIKVDNVAGWVVVYADGVEIIRWEGNTGNSDIYSACFGWEASTNAQIWYDDMYIDDTTGEAAAAVVPIKAFPYRVSNGDGNYSQWTGSDGNSVNNSLLIDDVPVNSTDWVEATSADKLDSYATATYTLAANETCIAVIPTAVVRKAGTTEQIAIGTRSTSDSVGSDKTPTISFSPLFERQTTKPGGGVWDQTALDNLEPLIKSRGTY